MSDINDTSVQNDAGNDDQGQLNQSLSIFDSPASDTNKPEGTPAVDANKVEGSDPDQVTQTQTPVAPAPAPVVDVKELLKGLQQNQQPQQAQAAPVTQEEIDKALGKVTVTPDMFKSIMGLDAQPGQVEALQGAFDAVVKNSAKMAYYMQAQQKKQIDDSLKELRESLTPLQQQYQQQQHNALKEQFFSKNPDLKDYEPLAETVYNDMLNRGVKFKSMDEAFTSIANTTKQLIQKVIPTNPNGAAPNGQQVQQVQTPSQVVPTKPAMAATNVGGQRGGGQPNANERPKPSGIEVFN